jgi:hypothetical protein
MHGRDAHSCLGVMTCGHRDGRDCSFLQYQIATKRFVRVMLGLNVKVDRLLQRIAEAVSFCT